MADSSSISINQAFGLTSNTRINGNASLNILASTTQNTLASTRQGSATAQNGSQNPDFSLNTTSPTISQAISGKNSPLTLLIGGNLSNGSTISARSNLSSQARNINGASTADTASQTIGASNTSITINGSISSPTNNEASQSGLLIDAYSIASTKARGISDGNDIAGNIAATTFLQNAGLQNSTLQVRDSARIQLQSRVNANSLAEAVTKGPSTIDIDPGSNPTNPDYNGSSNVRNAAGVVSLSSLASVGLAPYSTGVSESPVALPPQTDFTPIPPTFPASISLPPTNPDTGLVINGTNNLGRLGQSITGIGDFNRDGIDDLAVAAPEANKAYVLYGKSSGFGTGVDFNNLAASDGVTIQNININGSFQGTSPIIAPAGDLNNDGFADLAIIGNISNATGYIIYGRPTSSSSGPIDGLNLGSSDGFRITGIPNNQNSGPELNITGVGDVNGDGIDDLFIANATTNEAFLIFGTTGQANEVNISSGLGSSGVTIVNSESGINTNTRLGLAATGLGDINGDRIDDFAVSAPGLQGLGGSPGDGRVYVIYGGSFGTTPITLSTSPSISGTQISGASGFAIGGVANEGLGRYLAAGDVNGDSKPDLVVNSIGGAGKDYIVFGRNANDTPFTDIATSQIQAPDGLVVTGTSGLAGITGRLNGPISISDINGDQIGDIIQNNPFGSPKEVAVIFGQSQSTSTTRELASIVDGTNGFLLTDNGFRTVSSGSADINNDGAADILLGDSLSSSDGKIGIIFGRNPSLPPPPAPTATDSKPLEVGQGGELQLNSTITSNSTATNTTGSALAIDNSSSIGAALLTDSFGTSTNLSIAGSGTIQAVSNSNSSVTGRSIKGDTQAIGNLITAGILNLTPATGNNTGVARPQISTGGLDGGIGASVDARSSVNASSTLGSTVASTGSIYGSGPTFQSPSNALSTLGAAILGISEVDVMAPKVDASVKGTLITRANSITGEANANSNSSTAALQGNGATTLQTRDGISAIASLANSVVSQTVTGNTFGTSFANVAGVEGYQVLIEGSGSLNVQVSATSITA